jgi:hypothetical protein
MSPRAVERSAGLEIEAVPTEITMSPFLPARLDFIAR